MELALSPEDAAFRDEVRAFIADNYPPVMRVRNPEIDLTKERMLLWPRITCCATRSSTRPPRRQT